MAVRGERGFTLIEVLASSLILGVVAAGTLGVVDATTRSSYQTRLHTDLQALAQKNQDMLRGLSINELANLNKTLSPPPIDGVYATVNEQASYVADATGAASCTSPSTDYIKITSTVTWKNMGAMKPIAVSSIVTPPVASADATTGGIAVQVSGQSLGSLPVSISGPTSGTVVTDSNGCALFANLTPGVYTINLNAPAGATYVDELTGQAITLTIADTLTSPQNVAAGAITRVTGFTVAPAGSLDVSFASTAANPSGVAPGAVAVVAYNSTMLAPNLRVCAGQDTICPTVSNPDTSFPAQDWPQVSGAPFTATPLYPFNATYSQNYTVYAGTCFPGNMPSTYSGTNQTATVSSGIATSVTVTVPAMVIHVWSGTSSTSQGSQIAPTDLYIKDTGCSVRYSGYPNNGGTPPTPSPGQTPQQAEIPFTTNPASTTGGLLAYPGMPYGTYRICVDNGNSASSKYWVYPTKTTTVTNNDSSPAINIYMGATQAGGASGELNTC